MLHLLRLQPLLLLVSLGLAVQAGAVPVTVQLTGTWDSVLDTAGVLDGSIVVGGSWTATLVYDDSAPDLSPSPTTGSYSIPAAAFDLTFTSGSYSFSLSASESGEISIDDGVSGSDAVPRPAPVKRSNWRPSRQDTVRNAPSGYLAASSGSFFHRSETRGSTHRMTRRRSGSANSTFRYSKSRPRPSKRAKRCSSMKKTAGG